MAQPLLVDGILGRRAEAVDRALDAYLGIAGPAGGRALRESARHVVRAGGKRLRPALTLLACEAVGGQEAAALPAACGVELLHTFTLVHDDIMDGALVRRHRPTVEAVWGAPQALLTGDALFTLAFQAFADSARAPGVAPERVVALVQDASRTSLQLARGQAMDLAFQTRSDVGVPEALEMVRLKTGALLGLALRAGARVGGGDGAAVDALGVAGERLGAAYQLRDDLLDVVGSRRGRGKPVGADVRGGKRTPLVAYALERLTDPDRSRLLAILDAPAGRTGPAEVAEATGLLQDAGALDWARNRAGALREVALDALESAAAAVGDAGSAGAFAELGAVADRIAPPEPR